MSWLSVQLDKGAAVVKHFIVALKIGYIEHGEAEKVLEIVTIRTKSQKHRLSACTSVHKNNRAAAFSSVYSLS